MRYTSRHIAVAAALVFALVTIVALGIYLLSASDRSEDGLYRNGYYLPYTWGLQPVAKLTASDLKNSRKPLIEVMELFRLLYMSDEAGAIEFADAMIAKYSLLDPNPTLPYRDEHKTPNGILPAGWYSSMGNMLLPILLFDLNKMTGEARYATAATNLFRSSIRDMRDGGVVIRDGEGCHLVEYAHPSFADDDTIFVWNGHLFALEAAYLLQQYPEVRDEARELYTCARNKTRATAPEFRSDGYAYYQINPKKVDPMVYLIFETIEFRALYQLTNEEFYHDEAAYRESILKAAFPIRYRKTETGFNYLVSLVSFPHPYNVSTFITSLSCTGVESGKTYSVENSDRSSTLKKGFLRITSPENSKDAP